MVLAQTNDESRMHTCRYYNYLYISWLLPSAVGPAISVLMFHFLGDTWTIQDLQPIFFCGLALEVSPQRVP